MAYITKHYQPSRWLKFFYHEDATTTDGEAQTFSDIGFDGPWQLHNLTLRFSTALLNTANDSLVVTLNRRMPTSVVLASNHSIFKQVIMSVSLSGVISVMLRDSWGSMIEDFYLQSGDYIDISWQSTMSVANAWAIDVDGWAVAGK